MTEQRYRTLLHGAVAGLVGYLSIAFLFAIVNIIAGRSPFYTAAVLGTGLTSGTAEAAPVAIAPGPIFAYNALHLIIFLIIGVLASSLVTWSEHGEPGAARWYVGLFLFMFVLFHLLAAAQGFTQSVADALSGRLIWGAGSLAAAMMIGYLIVVSPALRRQLPAAPYGVTGGRRPRT
jgi:hypothetical protein